MLGVRVDGDDYSHRGQVKDLTSLFLDDESVDEVAFALYAPLRRVGHDVVGVSHGFETVTLVPGLLAGATSSRRAVGDRGLREPLGRGWHWVVHRVATEQRLQLGDPLRECRDLGVLPTKQIVRTFDFVRDLFRAPTSFGLFLQPACHARFFRLWMSSEGVNNYKLT